MIVPDIVRPLQPFFDAGVLTEADVHVAATLARASGFTGASVAAKQVQLAAALAVRAPRFGHVCVDLATVEATVVADTKVLDHYDGTADPLAQLIWPDPKKWVKQLSKSTTLVRDGSALDLGDAEMARSALVLDGARLYLDRYFIYEQNLAEALRSRSKAGVRSAPMGHPEAIDQLFGTSAADMQRQAAMAMATQALTVLVGGPGTGKTRTIARALAAEVKVSTEGGSQLRVALAAPTGKAASRMAEAITKELAHLGLDDDVANAIRAIEPSTIHRLLGYRNGIQFRHDRRNLLRYDLIIVDEVSMVSAPLMARLLGATSAECRLVLVGDPFQLASVEAGAVLGDIVQGKRLALNLVKLTKVHRFAESSGIAKLADAIAKGDASSAIGLLDSQNDLELISPEDAKGRSSLERLAARHAADVVGAALEGRGLEALSAGSEFKILCGTRYGPMGLRSWQQTIEQRTADLVDRPLTGQWYVGRPVIVTRNDYLNRLNNGDVGVVVLTGEGLRVQIEGNEERLLAPSQLEAPETWWAMTVHKSQGSEFSHVVVSLPEVPAPILTRELLYTAVTRAKKRLTLFGSVDAVRAAIETNITRTSGLRDLLS